MLCDECGKREANVHIMQIGPDGRMERNLCEHCATLTYGDWIDGPSKAKKEVSPNEFLQSAFRGAQKEEPQGSETLSCPVCGMTYEEVKKTGRMGCDECYRAFRAQMEPFIRRVHGGNLHKGKIPRRTGRAMGMQQEIVNLRARLQQAVSQEAYEQAAEYRDKIRELERRLREEGRHGEGA